MSVEQLLAVVQPFPLGRNRSCTSDGAPVTCVLQDIQV